MSDGKPIIVVKKKGGHGGHHGGAWKVAYADFVTAMMAFFMVMWLVNSADTVTKKSIASYFKKPGLFQSGSGTPLMIGEAGILQDAYVPAKRVYKGVTGGEVKMDENNINIGDGRDKTERQLRRGDGRMDGASNPDQMKLKKKKKGGASAGESHTGTSFTSNASSAAEPQPEASLSAGGGSKTGGELAAGILAGGNEDPSKSEVQGIGAGLGKNPTTGAELNAAQLERKLFEQTAKEIQQMVRGSPELAELLGIVDVKWENDGLNIEIVDTEETSMFASGSAKISEGARFAFSKIARLLGKLPNQVQVIGHTDSKPFRGGSDYTNWELSSDRAHAARRLLVENGIPANRITGIVGKADTEPRVKDPLDPSNRRITLKMKFKYNQQIGKYTAEELFKPKPRPAPPVQVVPPLFEGAKPTSGQSNTNVTLPPNPNQANQQPPTLEQGTINPLEPAPSPQATQVVHGLSYRPKKLIKAKQSKKEKSIQLQDIAKQSEAPPSSGTKPPTNNPVFNERDIIFKDSPVLGPADLFLGQ